ncbi:protein translocase subunit SecD [Haloechinothrix sp. LS1_15]|uniref:protein translocase subunit SecD n=1 Tax=Haloechinothrix sp. LS1_15 TaxID=2652248 RepID=UPI0029457884|nr:protein translocase subunit SecD [Haloechinothrix sp. LS1_15]MDV6013319.1 protein translocase subunit SecD [Haloechinothrix sp. LS1_15]
MAPPAGTIRPGRYLAFFLLIMVVLYGLVFFTGDREARPTLGIDLSGGTTVTMTARTADGEEPERERLEQAREVINERVDGMGVAGTEVVLDGSNIVITVPGEEGEEARTLGQTAKLQFREVIAQVPVEDEGAELPEDPESDAQQGAEEPEEEGEEPAEGGGATRGGERPATGGDAVREQDPGDNGNGGNGDAGGAAIEQDELIDEETRQEILEAREVRQNPDIGGEGPEAQQAIQAALDALDCSPSAADPLRGNDDPELPLVACSQDREPADLDDPDAIPPSKYVLGPVILEGERIDEAGSSIRQDGPGFQVNLSFDGEGTRTWAEITSEFAQHPEQKRVAFVLDTQVVSAPSVDEPIPGGDTRITGNFGQREAQELADFLEFGALPLSFEQSDARTVSPTLGLASLQAGLLAGAIGFALVIGYSLLYYRLLGALLVASLGLTAALIYPVIVLLSRWMGYTLDLAGVAGLIIAIGVTADSFVVYFERLKDEIRTGRTVRSAVPRAWVRARRTILSADAVVFIAAGVLYLLAVGQVKGFAFTIGLTTVLDLVVVFLVTHPLLVIAGHWKVLNNRKLSGLGWVQDLGVVAQRQRESRARGIAPAEGT